MSNVALDWAWQQGCATPSQKLVLIALADHHNSRTGACYPSIDRLVERTGLSRATVFRTLAMLARQGLVTYDQRKGSSNSYALAMEGSHPETEKSHHETEKSQPETEKSHHETQTVKNHKEPERTVRAHRLPADWKPSDDLLAWARASFPQLDVDYECDNFTDYWHGCGKPKVDWRATWRNWMRRSAKQSASAPRPLRRNAGSVDENRRRIDAALARRAAGDEGPRDQTPRLRLIDGGGGGS